MVARLRRGHRVGQSDVVQSCGVQLGKFHREVPTAIGGPLPESGAVGQMAPGRSGTPVGAPYRESTGQSERGRQLLRVWKKTDKIFRKEGPQEVWVQAVNPKTCFLQANPIPQFQ